jgi:hypothetical protein
VIARRRWLPRRRLAGVGPTWPSGLHLGRGQALEVEHDAVNSSRRSRRRIRARRCKDTGKLGEAVAAEGERERAVAAKKGGATSACGSFAQRPPRLPRIRCGLTRSERGRVSRRGRGRRRGWSAGPRCGGAGPRAVAERPAGGERNRGGEGEGEEDADVRAPGVGEKGESGGG